MKHLKSSEKRKTLLNLMLASRQCLFLGMPLLVRELDICRSRKRSRCGCGELLKLGDGFRWIRKLEIQVEGGREAHFVASLLEQSPHLQKLSVGLWRPGLARDLWAALGNAKSPPLERLDVQLYNDSALFFAKGEPELPVGIKYFGLETNSVGTDIGPILEMLDNRAAGLVAWSWDGWMSRVVAGQDLAPADQVGRYRQLMERLVSVRDGYLPVHDPTTASLLINLKEFKIRGQASGARSNLAQTIANLGSLETLVFVSAHTSDLFQLAEIGQESIGKIKNLILDYPMPSLKPRDLVPMKQVLDESGITNIVLRGFPNPHWSYGAYSKAEREFLLRLPNVFVEN